MCLAAPKARNQRHLEPCLGLLELYSHFLSQAWCSLCWHKPAVSFIPFRSLCTPY